MLRKSDTALRPSFVHRSLVATCSSFLPQLIGRGLLQERFYDTPFFEHLKLAPCPTQACTIGRVVEMSKCGQWQPLAQPLGRGPIGEHSSETQRKSFNRRALELVLSSDFHSHTCFAWICTGRVFSSFVNGTH